MIYRCNILTGYKSESDILYSTQDQGSQTHITGNTTPLLDVHQTSGGDGYPFKSNDGRTVWRWERKGEKVWGPIDLYNTDGSLKNSWDLKDDFDHTDTIALSKYNSSLGWVQVYIDHSDPTDRMWLLTHDLEMVVNNGTSLSNYH